ncbi:MAG: hypothetical protein ACK5GD_08780 [Planctomycetota bacterium]
MGTRDHILAFIAKDLEGFFEDRSQFGKDWAATNTAVFVMLDLWLRDAHSIAAHDAFGHVTAFHAAFGYPQSTRHHRKVLDRDSVATAGTEYAIVWLAIALTTRGKKPLERSQHLITRVVRETEIGESLRGFGGRVLPVTAG